MQARNENTHLKNNIKNIYYFIWLHWSLARRILIFIWRHVGSPSLTSD